MESDKMDILYFDFSKMFVMVSHCLLLKKEKNFSISERKINSKIFFRLIKLWK